jgi:hypothetical protein
MNEDSRPQEGDDAADLGVQDIGSHHQAHRADWGSHHLQVLTTAQPLVALLGGSVRLALLTGDDPIGLDDPRCSVALTILLDQGASPGQPDVALAGQSTEGRRHVRGLAGPRRHCDEGGTILGKAGNESGQAGDGVRPTGQLDSSYTECHGHPHGRGPQVLQ